MSNVSQWEVSAPNNDAAPPDGAPEGMAASVTIPARGRVVVSCAAAGSDYVGGDITGNTT